MIREIKQKRQHSHIRGCLAVVCVFLLYAISGCRNDGSAVVIQDPQGEVSGQADVLASMPEQNSSGQSGEEISAETEAQSAVTEAEIWVHVCGQVNAPGVYSLPQGSRVWDAVEAAGGITELGSADAVNLALVISDGSKITIPSTAEAESGVCHWYDTGTGRNTSGTQSEATDSDGRVDINRADAEDLEQIPGIGQARAEAIVGYREQHGYFGSIEEIMNVSGIKEGLFAKIREYITVGG